VKGNAKNSTAKHVLKVKMIKNALSAVSMAKNQIFGLNLLLNNNALANC
jgi:hypothetical protein